jgi:hypothetical protein
LTVDPYRPTVNPYRPTVNLYRLTGNVIFPPSFSILNSPFSIRPTGNAIFPLSFSILNSPFSIPSVGAGGRIKDFFRYLLPDSVLQHKKIYTFAE